jgi:hypothetical protein
MYISGPHQGTGEGPVLVVSIFGLTDRAKATEIAYTEAVRAGFGSVERVLDILPNERPDGTHTGLAVYLLLSAARA